MHSILKEKLQAYITEHNPELLERLQAELSVTEYLEHKIRAVMPYVLELLAEEKPGPVIAELALEQMTATLRPSRYDYIKEVLATEFSEDYQRFKKMGVLTYEGIRILEQCQEVFETFGFKAETAGYHLLRHAIIAGINKALEFKGLKAQYIWYFGAGILILLILLGLMYLIGLPSFICVGVILLAGTGLVFKLYGMSNKYGEHGMMKAIAQRSIPKLVKSNSRKVFRKSQETK
eukprot:gene13726-16700_t